MPVIILTARDSVTDTVAALDSGADDYMAKPFRFAELMARVRLRLRALAPVDAPATRRRPRRRQPAAGPAYPPRLRAPGRVRALGPRVRARRDLPAQPRPGAHPRAAARPGVGLRLRPRLQRRRRLRRLPPQEARHRRHRDRPRGRLPARPRERRAGASAPDLEARQRPAGQARQHRLERLGDLVGQRPLGGSRRRQAAITSATGPARRRAARAGASTSCGKRWRTSSASGSPCANGRGPATAWKRVAPRPQTSEAKDGASLAGGSHCSGDM